MPKDSLVDEVEVLDFYADWCAPCHIVNPILDELVDEFKDKIRVVKVNVDVERSLAEKYDVYSLPTIILLRKGREVNRVVGAKSKDHYRSVILESLQT